MRNGLRNLIYRLAAYACFQRISIRQRERLPATGPLLVLGLHRNGALDGLPYAVAVPDATFLISAQLHRSWLGRLLIPGIPVARLKDRRRGIKADNREAFRRCKEELRQGRPLFVMPEGTSTLGATHLPLQPGAARIAQLYLEGGHALTVVPLAVHYECAWEWQSRVEVVIGEPFNFSPGGHQDIEEMLSRFSSALEHVGVTATTVTELRLIESLAYAASRETGLDYSACLKALEADIPDDLRAAAATLTATARQSGAAFRQGIPLIPAGSVLPELLVWVLAAPLMAAFWLCNLPPLASGYLAARYLPDDLNVVAFWRAAVGLPVAAAWSAAVSVALGTAVSPWAAAAYIAGSLAALRLTHFFRTLSVSVANAIRAPHLRQPMATLRMSLRRKFTDV